MTRSIALLGSTGSIGRQTLEVARELGLTVAALTANSSVDLIEQQAREFCPRLAVLYDEAAAAELRERLREELLELLADLTIPAVIITHDPDDVDAFAGGLILYNHGRARQVPDYQRLRRDFATAGQCLRHLQEEEGGLLPRCRSVPAAVFSGALTPRPVSARIGDAARSH